MPMEYSITNTLPNGEQLTASVGLWVVALLSILPEQQSTLVHERVAQMTKEAKESKIVQPVGLRMHAETGRFFKQ